MMRFIESNMRDKLRNAIFHSHQFYTHSSNMKPQDRYEKWLNDFPGQIVLTTAQIVWTWRCFDTITTINAVTEKNDKEKMNMMNQDKNDGKPRKNIVREQWNSQRNQHNRYLDDITKLVRKISSELVKLKIVALITVEVHARDLIDVLSSSYINTSSFEWTKLLRFKKQEQSNDSFAVNVEQGNATFPYGFEYQGNNGRLVITPLTDRCYITLTTAMQLRKGGAPQGPAGTGKTETVKDLGKNMARFVFIFNCSEGLDVKSLKDMFEGFAQTGSWGCFDEFNRIEIEVLSVVAIQISTILDAIATCTDEKRTFEFEDKEIPLDKNCSIFITMNPGYAGRTELPDNLKALFRPMSMMTPDFILICKITLQAEGFKSSDNLAKKIETLYKLMGQQLSKQAHYDFGLRAIKSVLVLAGQIRRERQQTEKKTKQELSADDEATLEQTILIKAIMDMNDPKLVSDDIPLFEALLQDLFPNEEISRQVNEKLYNAVEDCYNNDLLDCTSYAVNKTMQLHYSKMTRHGNMIVGNSFSGKSTLIKMLKDAMNVLHQTDPKTYHKTRTYTLNPKSINLQELYGYFDNDTETSVIGVFSYLMDYLCNKDESEDERWIVFDGPIDTKWIESMNSLLDDNKVLTLLDGNRINLHPLTSLVFECEHLNMASPATVSRCGMVYLDFEKLDWNSIRYSWISDKEKKGLDNDSLDSLEDLFDKWVEPILIKRTQLMKDAIKICDSSLILSLCKLIDALCVPENGIDYEERERDELFWIKYEKFFIFAVIWTLGAPLDEDSRKAFDYQIRDIESVFPFSQTVFDYYLNLEKNEFVLWEEKLTVTAQNWKPPSGVPSHRYLVETVDTARSRYLLSTMLKVHREMLLIGTTGTGKTALINSILQG